MTATAGSSPAWRALAERAERARAQAVVHCADLERLLSRTRAFDPLVDSQAEVGHRVAQAEAEARIHEMEELVDGLTKRLESQAPVEQAKGIIMAQTHCGPDKAFEILRRASQRSNTKLRLLAEDLVARTSGSERGP